MKFYFFVNTVFVDDDVVAVSIQAIVVIAADVDVDVLVGTLVRLGPGT